MKKMETLAVFAAILLLLGMATGYAEEEVEFEETWTSGPFAIAPEAHDVDWAILNNSKDSQEVRVTVYQCPIGSQKVIKQDYVYSIDAGTAIHNANLVCSSCVYTFGFLTEVVVGVNDENVHPMVVQWRDYEPPDEEPGGPYYIPGTLIPSGDFVKIEKPKDK